MPTISQLPTSESVSAEDLVPVSQGGSVHSVSIGVLLAQSQPAIMVDPPSLLGRSSVGRGGPDAIALGSGLSLNNGTLSASTFNPSVLPLQAGLSSTDQIIVTSAGSPQLLNLDQLRGLFTAGPNINIDTNGTISAAGSGTVSTITLAGLSSVTSLGPDDLIAVRQAGQDHAVSYSNLLSGLTIDAAAPAGLASDGDTFWVAQTSNFMLRQTLGNLWPWLSSKLPSWKHPVIELNANATLSGAVHGNAIIVCSSPISISATASDIGSGFCCRIVNASSGAVSFTGSIITPSGLTTLSPYQCGSICCVTYSGGSLIIASIGMAGTATAPPGQPSGITTSMATPTSLTLSWLAPLSGGSVSVYSVQYRTTGSASWLLAGQTNGSQSLAISGLQPQTSYDFTVSATNNVATGPTSSTLTVTTPAANPSPGAPTAVIATNVRATSFTCSWNAPIGTGLVYAVQYRVSGQSNWISAAANFSATTITIGNLLPSTAYDIQITASTSNGSGPPSAIVTVTTAQAVGAVTSITWNLVPSGSFAHGVGAIGVNAHVNPATAAIQFGFSTSSSTLPTQWTAGVTVNSDLWGQYVPTPPSAGTWYAWAEGTDGSAPTVYATPFTVT